MPRQYFALALLLGSSFGATAGDAGNFHLDIPMLTAPAEIDGRLDDAVWQQAATTQLTIETGPGENTPAPVMTDAKIFATQESLFVAFIAHDPDPSKIRANLSPRDRNWGDDLVGIKLDTYNDARLAYQFFINPFGVQADSIENELTGRESDAWDGIWYAAGEMTDKGYQVEIELPFRMFNFDKASVQEWGFELIRYWPRDENHRLSTQARDRDNNCTLCQLGVVTGLEDLEQGNDLQITPSLVAGHNRDRELPNGDWQDETDVDVGVDVRWGITPDLLLSATINPDFSQVEADAGQLDVNNTFALFFPEKRAFFLDNKDYFDTQMNLVYTRNIGDPDYGAKLTGREGQHTFGALVANDTQTRFLVPGNLSSSVASIDKESQNVVGRYRYDVSSGLSIGALTTLRKAGDYHNYQFATDIKYQPTDQDTFTAQYSVSNTQYPEGLYKEFCGDSDNCEIPPGGCERGDCDINERVLRLLKQEDFDGDLLRLRYQRETRNWYANLHYQATSADYRADLGFVDRVDFNKFVAGGGYIWYPEDATFNRIRWGGDWDITHNDAGEELEREIETSLELEGKLQSYMEMGLVHRSRVGLREDKSILNIEDNTTLFHETFGWFYGEFWPAQTIKTRLNMSYGDTIDFANNRPGTNTRFRPGISWDVMDNLALDFAWEYRSLDVAEGELFNASLGDLRLNWQLSLQSFLRVSSVYTDIQRDPSLYLYSTPDSEYKGMFNEVLYGYQLNPQSVFYLGYSDGFRQDDEIKSLTQDEQTLFMKISYAWLI
ncbi:carbohydrate binding family 9 domain-containing protein [Shewanella corallii]|uniref:Carbohydrate binding family 9 domain-containing protein n=1 Tax=Shewanella corallii TaxID=560080 RepID=A0ABT0NCQ0_9GAMM|nr:DUF5916 domain-containing protein [Shewanella corallii]MCL2915586.1 carbohydrate binding family 9 domain-containing protein [Shewanella corallii]